MVKAALTALAIGVLGFGLSALEEARAADYNLRLATVVKSPHPWVSAAEYMADEMKKRSDGQVEITIFEGGTLGADSAALDQMRIGTIDLMIGGTTNITSLVREFQVFSLDYLFPDMDSFREVTAADSPVVDKIQESVDSRNMGFKILAMGSGGVRNLSNSVKPIEKPEDLAGMKMRVPGAKIAAEMWAAFGALPTSLPWTEVYSALQTGVVQAFDSTISSYLSSKLYEVGPYHAKTEHQIMASYIAMSTMSFDRLPEELQAAMLEVAAEAGVIITDKGEEFDAAFMDDLAERGAKINEVDKAAFKAIADPLHEKLAEEAGVADMLVMIREMQE